MDIPISRRKPLLLRRAALIAAGALLLACGAARGGAESTMNINGREAIITSPARMDAAPASVIVALHGGLGDAGNLQRSLALEDTPALASARIVYINGTSIGERLPNRLGWNAGDCCALPAQRNIDDVGYIASVINTLKADGLVAGNKVALVGHSNGAMMAMRFACERPDLVSAVVAISGQLVANRCPNASGVRVLQLHGTDDVNVPISGGIGQGVAGVTFPSSDMTRGMLQSAGASVDTQFVQGAEHRIGSIERALRRSGQGSIGDVVARFLRF